LTSGYRHQTDVSVIDFDPKNLKGEPLGEIDHKVIFICPKYLQDDTPIAYHEWLEAIQDSLDEEVEESHYLNPEIKRIFNLIEKDKVTPKERALMFDQHANEEFEQEVFDKWKEIGFDDGYGEGKEDGKKEGKEEEKMETARNLKALGVLTEEQIASVTGLSLKEVVTL